MILRIKYAFLLFLVLSSCKNREDNVLSAKLENKQKSYFSHEHLIEAEDLMTSLGQRTTKIIDFRNS